MAFIDTLRTIGQALTRSPNSTGSPAEENAQPTIQILVSRDVESAWIPGEYLDGISPNRDTILEREGSQDLKLYDQLLDDDVAQSNMQQRRLAVTSKDWEVSPGDDHDPRSVQAADDLRAMLKGLNFDNLTDKMLYAPWFGYGVAEGLFVTKMHDGRLIVWLDDVVVPDRRWFGFTMEGELRMISTLGTMGTEALPHNKFWALRTGASHDFAFYGLGLAHWCYWPIFFKRAATQFWMLYLEKYATPTILGAFADAASQDDKVKLVDALVAIGRDRAVAVSKTEYDNIKAIEATRSGAGASSYKDFITEQNEALMRIILGQPGTSKATPQGVGGKQSEVHEGVKEEIVKADSDLFSAGFNGTFAKWLTLWNHGPDVAPPTVYRVLEDVDDLDTIADRDTKLKGLGWERTEESFGEIYGDGYEKAAPPEPILPGLPGGQPMPAVNDNKAALEKAALKKKALAFGVDDVAPLYVYRPLLNAGDLVAWAKKQGFKTVVPASDLHTTLLYSKTPVDWFALDDRWGGFGGDKLNVAPGGARKVVALGGEGGEPAAVVLRFASSELTYRHECMVEKGASHDYPEYLPHITFTYDPGEVDLDQVEPYLGELRFGPEYFEPIKGDVTDPAMIAFDAGEIDAIERCALAMIEEGNPIFEAMARELQGSLQGVTTAEGARVAILGAMERLPIERLAEFTALPMLALRAAGRAGEGLDLTA